ncbi:DUF483 domain-containing protein [Candidatus Woesearchaeota archaeon]|nr:DUF483 domain-containing protein [Candidatus Woesearchaeota archaeon]
MISQLTPIFGSKTKAQEILFLLNDAKEVVRQGFYEAELPKVELFCKDNHLFLIKSKFKVLLEDKDKVFSNKGIRIDENDPRSGMFFIYLSKDEQKALFASYAELTNNHSELGRLLGYPACCIEFFCQMFNENNTNLELPLTNPWTNLSLREKDAVLLSHFPCSSECGESINLAQKYFDIIRKADAERAKELVISMNLSTATQ